MACDETEVEMGLCLGALQTITTDFRDIAVMREKEVPRLPLSWFNHGSLAKL